MKRKAEKKRLKKKKQKDRKKQAKLEQELRDKAGAEPRPSAPSGPAGGGHPQDSPDEEGGARAAPGSPSSAAPPGGDQGAGAEETEDELDLSCSFVRAAQHRAGVRPPPPPRDRPRDRPRGTPPGRGAAGRTPKPSPPTPQPREPLAASVVEQSLVLAGRGNEAAQRGHYAEAVLAFTEAVKLNPWEHRLFGNRSYCYEKLRRYEEALRDAEVALGLQPGWLKGFFRKGKALRGLQRYAEAANTFEELLRRDGASADARAQLETCRALLRQHGPRARSGPGGVPVSPSLLEAEEPPLPFPREQASGSCRNTSGFVTVQSTRSQARGQGQPAAGSKQPLPPTHPARDCYPLWVGNVTPGITEKVLRSSFGRFGEIRFVRALPQRRCAFINYARKKAAEAAYAAMQDAELEGSRLVLQLKHPSHATPSPQRGAHPRGLR